LKKLIEKLSFKDYVFILLALFALGAFIFQKTTSEEEGLEDGRQWAEIEIGEVGLGVFIADTEEERYNGLSGLEEIAYNEGMLFVHDAPGRYAYVMRGMLFDLDFIFINGDKVVDIARNVAYEYTGEIEGATDYDKVLEVNAEWARYNNIKIGDNVSF
jgi:uncharacterized membrane protein (UPF0127 family)